MKNLEIEKELFKVMNHYPYVYDVNFIEKKPKKISALKKMKFGDFVTFKNFENKKKICQRKKSLSICF